jgi:hypothetical protein
VAGRTPDLAAPVVLHMVGTTFRPTIAGASQVQSSRYAILKIHIAAAESFHFCKEQESLRQTNE